jgi:hypothetical protein
MAEWHEQTDRVRPASDTRRMISGTLNGSIQIFPRRELFYKAGIRPILHRDLVESPSHITGEHQHRNARSPGDRD